MTSRPRMEVSTNRYPAITRHRHAIKAYVVRKICLMRNIRLSTNINTSLAGGSGMLNFFGVIKSCQLLL